LLNRGVLLPRVLLPAHLLLSRVDTTTISILIVFEQLRLAWPANSSVILRGLLVLHIHLRESIVLCVLILRPAGIGRRLVVVLVHLL